MLPQSIKKKKSRLPILDYVIQYSYKKGRSAFQQAVHQWQVNALAGNNYKAVMTTTLDDDRMDGIVVVNYMPHN